MADTKYFYAAGDKRDESFFKRGMNTLDLTDPAIQSALKVNLSNHYGIPEPSISLYVSSAKDPDALEVQDGASFDLVWTANEITGIDLTPETSKRILKATATKSEIIADGVDETAITLEIWKADDSEIDTAVNASRTVPIITPDGIRMVKAQFSNGTVSRTFKTTKAGLWQFPDGRRRYENVRISSTATVSALLDFGNL